MLMDKNCTYKEFGKYLREIANLYAQYGDEPLEYEKEYEDLHLKLCQLHHTFDHGAREIENLKDIFVRDCMDFGSGWFPPAKERG